MMKTKADYWLDYVKLERLAGERGLTLGDLAKRMRYQSASSIYNLRTQSARAVTVGRLAKFFGVPFDDLLAPAPAPQAARKVPLKAARQKAKAAA